MTILIQHLDPQPEFSQYEVFRMDDGEPLTSSSVLKFAVEAAEAFERIGIRTRVQEQDITVEVEHSIRFDDQQRGEG